MENRANNQNKFKHPNGSFGGKLIELLLNNLFFLKFKRFLFYPFSKVKLASNIENVVYLNWLVDINKAKAILPEGITLKTYGDKTLLTVLTYTHGNLRPSKLSFIKKIFGSPQQSNWRFYLNEQNSFTGKKSTVYFIHNILGSLLYSFGSRIFSNSLLSHFPKSFTHFGKDQLFTTEIVSGKSNSFNLKSIVETSSKRIIPSDLQVHYKNWDDMVLDIIEQDFAVTPQIDNNHFCISEISLGFEKSKIKTIEINHIENQWLMDNNIQADCFGFIIPKVDFHTLNETMTQL